MYFKTKIHKNFITFPIVLWTISIIIVSCIASPNDENLEYDFILLIYTLLISTPVMFILIGLIYLRKYKIIITGKEFLIVNVFNKPLIKYNFSDIIDFNWSAKPKIRSSKYSGVKKFKTDHFEIQFKNGGNVVVKHNDFSNFYELRKLIFNYCISNKIIEIRPLEERKRSKLKLFD